MDRLPPQTPSKERRERTIAALCEHFASDRLEIEELEARLDAANRARTVAELNVLLRDLPALHKPAQMMSSASEAVARGGRAMDAAIRNTRALVAFLGGVEWKGQWVPARRNLVVAVMGGACLDFREVRLPPGQTEVVLFCFMGGTEIIVPPGLGVDANGIAIMGGFESSSPAGSDDPDAPVLKLTGVAIMGGVEITVREPGESAKDARLRERERHRELKEERESRRTSRRLPPDRH
jgi:hypothetical protein